MMKTTYHSNGHQIIATRGSVMASIEAPIQGQYTDRRKWLGLLKLAVVALDSKLEVEEWSKRL